jgi:hypothetical protein
MEVIAKSLYGNFKDEPIFTPQHAVDLFDIYS